MDRIRLMRSGIVSINVKTTIPPTKIKTTPMAAPRFKLNLNSKIRTSGRRINAMSVERMSVKTRSGKKEAIQKRIMMRPKKAMTFINGLLDVEVDANID